MPILKIEKRDSPFVIMDQRPLNDVRLSWKAKGLLAYLLSKPHDWEVWVKDLVERSRDGKAAVYSALDELTKWGYVERKQQHRPDGTFRSVEYLVREQPLSGFPHTEKPHTENRTYTNKDCTNKDSTSKEKKVSATPTGPKPHPIKGLLKRCEDTWGYPMPNGGKEAKAAKALQKRHSDDDIIACLSWLMGAPFYQDKHVTLWIVNERIGPWIKLGRPTVYQGGNGDGRRTQRGPGAARAAPAKGAMP
jgi:hypothetical protein